MEAASRVRGSWESRDGPPPASLRSAPSPRKGGERERIDRACGSRSRIALAPKSGARLSGMTFASLRSLGRHAQRAVDADHLAVEIAVLDDVARERGILLRLAEHLRERHRDRETMAHFFG